MSRNLLMTCDFWLQPSRGHRVAGPLPFTAVTPGALEFSERGERLTMAGGEAGFEFYERPPLTTWWRVTSASKDLSPNASSHARASERRL